MFLTNLFKFKKSCAHEKIAPDVETAYCPDCGKLIQNEWYITRCSCCGMKLRTIIHNDKVEPQYHFCKNCGSSEFTVEKIPKINFIDINFAVLKRQVIENDLPQRVSTQCWQEKSCEPPKLLVQYL